MQLDENWTEIRKIFAQSFRSSLHYALATVSEDGEPHITPIGSLILRDAGQGFYFEEFPTQLTQNLAHNNRVSVLAVNSSRWYWIKSLFAGRFNTYPAIRLYATAGELREANEREIQLWQKRVRILKASKGHALIWKNMNMVRDLTFYKASPVSIGAMTQGLQDRQVYS